MDIYGALVPQCFTYCVTYLIQTTHPMSQIKAVPILKLNKADRFGNVPIWLRITQNRKSTYIATGYKCKPEEWDDDSKKVSKSVDHSILINGDLKKQIARIEKEVIEHRIMDQSLSITMVKNISINQSSKFDFHALAEAMIADTSLVKPKTTFTNTYRHKVFKDFRQHLKCSEISVELIKKYIVFLKKKGLMVNTISGYLSFVSTVINKAIAQKIMKKDDNPFPECRVDNEEKVRMYLTMEELQRLEENLRKGHRNQVRIATGWYYLLSCYSGLRYIDAVKFDEDLHVQNGQMEVRTTKTGAKVFIPIHSRLAGVIKMIKQFPVPPTPHEVSYNLKTLAKSCDIPKRIYYHSSRHTFAIECARLKISIETVKKLLGHSKVETTAIYYKIHDERVNEEMKAWD